MNDQTKLVFDVYQDQLGELLSTSPSFETFISDTKDVIKGDLWARMGGHGFGIQFTIMEWFIKEIHFGELCLEIERTLDGD